VVLTHIGQSVQCEVLTGIRTECRVSGTDRQWAESKVRGTDRPWAHFTV